MWSSAEQGLSAPGRQCPGWDWWASSCDLHSRVDESVGEVNNDVHHDNHRGGEDEAAQDHREVAGAQGVDRGEADTMQVEDRLGEDGPTEGRTKVQTEDRQDRRERGPQSVLEEDATMADALSLIHISEPTRRT